MMDRDLLYYMAQRLDTLERLNEQISSGKKVNKFSDDVPAAGEMMLLGQENTQLNTCLRNAVEVTTMLQAATSALQETSTAITRVKELAVQAATGTYGALERRAIAEEVNQLLGTLVELANPKALGGYIFSGEATATASFVTVDADADGKADQVEYRGEPVSTQVKIAPFMTGELNLVGNRLFQGEGDLFGTVIALRKAMENNDQLQIQNLITSLNTSDQDIRESLSRLGGRQNEIETLANSLQTFTQVNTDRISELGDTDVMEATLYFTREKTALQSIMQIAASAARPSILDYL
jgi:flagellar hook-associated protein 3 FlgL